jgi:hypothetical protein
MRVAAGVATTLLASAPFATLVHAQDAKPAAPPTAESTKRMAALLEERADAAIPEKCQALSVQRAAIFKKRAANAAGTPREADLRLKLAVELLQSGDPEAALAELDRAEEAARRDASDSGDAKGAGKDDDASGPEFSFLKEVDRTRALAWLRLGEIENCLGHHCCQSCIAPIEAGGQHTEKRGSQNAIPILERMLARQPDDYEARWLLNLAHMTLGTWPDGVAEKQRIAPSRFTSEYELPRFRDVAQECGITVQSISGGAITEDFDRDGFLDVMVSSMGLRDQLHYYRANGDGTFSDRTAEAGLTGEVGGLNLIQGDYDNDGFVDVFVLRGAWLDDSGEIPNSLLRNRGDGTFEDVTEKAGMLTFHPTQTGAFADFDGDGWLDLVVGNETQKTKAHPCELWLNQRDGTFKDVAAQVGANEVAFVKSVAVGDYDDDGRPDVFYSRRAALNLLKHNVKDDTPGGVGFKFVEVGQKAGVGQPKMSFPSWWFDYDNDGRLDLFVATNAGFTPQQADEIGTFMAGVRPTAEMPCLYHNLGNGKFVDVAPKVGLARAILSMGSNYGDLDNDGWLDVYLGNGAPSFGALLPNKAFRNDRGERFQDVTTATGMGHLQKGHGVAFADLDNDGDQDVFLKVGGFYTADVYPSALFENPGNANHWVTLRLTGVKANKSAIGARIRVDVTTPSGKRSIHLLCGSGGSFGASSLQQEVGLGDATAIDAVEIRWPGSGTVQKLEKLPLDQFVAITEGASDFQVVPVKKVKLGGGAR